MENMFLFIANFAPLRLAIKTITRKKKKNGEFYLLKPGLCFFAEPTVVVCESCE